MAMDDLRPLAYAIITPLFLLATASILLRIYCRGVLLKAFGKDDWTMASLLVRIFGHLGHCIDLQIVDLSV